MNTNTRLAVCLGPLAILVVTIYPCFAHAMGARGSNPCEPVMEKYCGGLLELGHEELVKCLKSHEDQLNSECKDALEPKPPAAAPKSYTSDSNS